MAVRTTHLASAGKFSTVQAAIGEIITNSVDAVINSEDKRVSVWDFVGKTSKYGKDEFIKKVFPEIKTNDKFVICLNSGTPVKSLERMLDNGFSTQEGQNHQYGLGHLAFLATCTPEEEVYITFTKYDDHCEYIRGKYVPEAEAISFDLKDWPFEDWVTATICKLENPDLLSGVSYKELCEKYTMALLEHRDLDIRFNFTKLYPVEPKGKKKIEYDLFYLPEIDADIKVIEYRWKVQDQKTDSTEMSGVSIFNHGVRICNTGVTLISKATKYKEDRKAEDWKTYLGYPSTMHHDFFGFATYVDVRPRGNKHFLEVKADKSSFKSLNSAESPNLMILRKFIDDNFGDTYRKAKEHGDEAEDRRVVDSVGEFFGLNNNDGIYITEVGIPSAKNPSEIKKISFKKADAMWIHITEANRKKIEKYRKSKNNEMYILGKEDCEGYVKLIEFKKSGKPLDVSDLAQLITYAELIEINLGIEQNIFHLLLVGGEVSDDLAAHVEYKMKKTEYTIKALSMH